MKDGEGAKNSNIEGGRRNCAPEGFLEMGVESISTTNVESGKGGCVTGRFPKIKIGSIGTAARKKDQR